MTLSSAALSDCGTYRYRLSRRWGAGRSCLFVMLNPSTADASLDDPTIRRCAGFARREGFDGMEVVNLMAFRATDPSALPADKTAEGPDNARHVADALRDTSGPVIAAWGAQRAAVPFARPMRGVIARAGRPIVCLGVTKGGDPRHPLYVRGDAPLVPLP